MGEFRRKVPASTEPSDKDLELILAVAKTTARRKGANHDEADDVAQSTVVKLWTKWEEPGVVAARQRPDAQWVAYIRTTASRIYVDRIRSHQRRLNRQTRSTIFHSGNTVTAPNGWQVPATPCIAEAHAARSFIAGEICGLPPKQRAVAEGIILLEMTVTELALHLGVQPQLVRKHLRAAKRTLTDRMIEVERSTG